MVQGCRSGEVTIVMKQDVCSLPEGTALFVWPSPLSQDSLEDLDDWLQLIRRKITRSVEVDAGVGK